MEIIISSIEINFNTLKKLIKEIDTNPLVSIKFTTIHESCQDLPDIHLYVTPKHVSVSCIDTINITMLLLDKISTHLKGNLLNV